MIWLVVVGHGQHESKCGQQPNGGLKPPGFRNSELERQLPEEEAPCQVFLVAYPISILLFSLRSGTLIRQREEIGLLEIKLLFPASFENRNRRQ